MTTRVFKCDIPGCKATFEWPEATKPGQAKAAAVTAGWQIGYFTQGVNRDMCGPCRFEDFSTSTPAVTAGWQIGDTDTCGKCRFGSVPTSTPAKA